MVQEEEQVEPPNLKKLSVGKARVTEGQFHDTF